jgi:hypothetical protein
MTKAERYVRANLIVELEDVQGSPISRADNGLTIYEKTLIYHYTKDGYVRINQGLRSHGQTDLEVVPLLESALRKLPPYQGIVHRTAVLTRKQLQSYLSSWRAGRVKAVPEFLSSSKSALIPRMRPRFNVKFRIVSRSGRSIEEVSYMGKHTPPNEQEVLFLPGSRFEISDVTDFAGYVLIFMEEV